MKAVLAFTSILIVAGAAGCTSNAPKGRVADFPPGVQYTPEDARTQEAANSQQARADYRNMTFEEFLDKVYREPKKYGGKYMVDGDRAILSEKQLREFFETEVKKDPATRAMQDVSELVVNTVGGQDDLWNDTLKRQLTYCVSDDFGNSHQFVVQAMQQAANAWEQAADIDFIHNDAEDDSCNASNADVVFDVRPVDVNGQYLARAFFPNEPRPARNVLIDDSAFSLTPGGNLTLVGILRHELGHTLGFRHEHTRPESGACFEDNNWRPITDYDALSVMHYPQCNGQGDWSLTLTGMDQNGAACVYGPAPGFTFDPSFPMMNCRQQVTSTCAPQTETFQGSVARAGTDFYGPFPVAPGTTFEAVMTGSGDPDLYVRYDQAPTASFYDCRPYLNGANETCSLTVPTGENSAHVMVRGYTAGSYTLTVTYSGATP